MSKLFKIILICLLTFFVAETSYAQKKSKGENYHENQTPFGKKRKEKRNQSKALSKRGGGGLFKKKFSAGNADAFASNSVRGKRGFFSRLFSGGGSSSKNASLRKTRPGKTQNKEQSQLFKRNRTKTKNNNSGFLHRQNKDRSAKRKRGNAVFSKKKR